MIKKNILFLGIILLVFTSCEDSDTIFIDMKIEYAEKLLKENKWKESAIPYGSFDDHIAYDNGNELLILHFFHDEKIVTRILYQSGLRQKTQNIKSYNFKTKETEQACVPNLNQSSGQDSNR